MKVKSEILLSIFGICIAISGILFIGFLDGFWDAFGVFLLMWANNIGYKRESIKEKLQDRDLF